MLLQHCLGVSSANYQFSVLSSSTFHKTLEYEHNSAFSFCHFITRTTVSPFSNNIFPISVETSSEWPLLPIFLPTFCTWLLGHSLRRWSLSLQLSFLSENHLRRCIHCNLSFFWHAHQNSISPLYIVPKPFLHFKYLIQQHSHLLVPISVLDRWSPIAEYHTMDGLQTTHTFHCPLLYSVHGCSLLH